RRARRNALRALRGSVLRTELYGKDGSTHQDRPYTVTEQAYDLREEPSQTEHGRPQVFFPLPIGQRTTHWERGYDPLTRFTSTGDYDPYGQPRRHTTVALPRRSAHRQSLTTSAGTFTPDEQFVLATHTRTQFAAPAQDIYIHDRVAQVRTYELVNPPEA